jgi:6,7-dimethyl-8-ribityllumazine synthase
MTSSDETRLPADAKERAAARVGSTLDGSTGDGRRLRIGFACAEFNGAITDRLLDGALDALEAAGQDVAGSVVVWVPGAFELPVVAQELARSDAIDAVVCLGAVIRGETGHYEFVAGECAAGLQRVQLDTGVPVAFGVLTTDDVDQALARSERGAANKGAEAVQTVIQTAAVLAGVASLPSGSTVGFAAGRS